MNKKLIISTEAEDAQITAAVLTDPDNLPLTDEELRQFTAPAMAGKHASMTRYGIG